MNNALCIGTFFYCQSTPIAKKNPKLLFYFKLPPNIDTKGAVLVHSFSVLRYSDLPGQLLDCCIGCVFLGLSLFKTNGNSHFSKWIKQSAE